MNLTEEKRGKKEKEAPKKCIKQNRKTVLFWKA